VTTSTSSEDLVANGLGAVRAKLTVSAYVSARVVARWNALLVVPRASGSDAMSLRNRRA
jgi:hypothetical protein